MILEYVRGGPTSVRGVPFYGALVGSEVTQPQREPVLARLKGLRTHGGGQSVPRKLWRLIGARSDEGYEFHPGTLDCGKVVDRTKWRGTNRCPWNSVLKVDL
jgi:hypothetical protein